jgi:hypothetical protein
MGYTHRHSLRGARSYPHLPPRARDKGLEGFCLWAHDVHPSMTSTPAAQEKQLWNRPPETDHGRGKRGRREKGSWSGCFYFFFFSFFYSSMLPSPLNFSSSKVPSRACHSSVSSTLYPLTSSHHNQLPFAYLPTFVKTLLSLDHRQLSLSLPLLHFHPVTIHSSHSSKRSSKS